MASKKKLSESEFKEMIKLLNRYVNYNMDQWEAWKFDSKLGQTFVDISAKSKGPIEAYDDLTKFV